MKKGVIVIVFVAIFVAAILFARFTGLVVTSVNTCTDTDAKDSSSKGEVYGVYYMFTKENYTFEDYCVDGKTLVEYYCVQDGMHSYKESMKYNCELGCFEGACKTGLLVAPDERPAPTKSTFEKIIDRIKAKFKI